MVRTGTEKSLRVCLAAFGLVPCSAASAAQTSRASVFCTGRPVLVHLVDALDARAAMMVRFAASFFAVMTPRACRANPLFAGRSYSIQPGRRRYGPLLAFVNLFILMVIGIHRVLLVAG